MIVSLLEQIPVFNQLPEDVQSTLAGLVLFIALLLIFSLLRGLIARLIVAPARSIISRLNGSFDDAVFDAANGTLSFFVLSVAIFLTTALLEFDPYVQTFLFRLALTLAVIGLVKFVYDLGSRLAQSRDLLKHVTPGYLRPSLVPLVRYMIRALVVIVGILAAAEIWEVDVAGLVAGLGLGGLAISLAGKEILDDFFGFLVIIYDNPFTVNDYIASKHGEGIVEHIGLRSTTIRRLDQGAIYIPNGTLVNEAITNWSRLQKRWFNFQLNVPLNTANDRIEMLVTRIKDMLDSRENVQQGTSVVLFTEYGDYAFKILIRFYVTIEDWTKAHEERHAINLEITRIVSELGVNVAMPSHSIYLEEIRSERAALQNESLPQSKPQAFGEIPSYFKQGGDDAGVDESHHDDPRNPG